MSSFSYYIYDTTGGDKTITTYRTGCSDETPVDTFSWLIYGDGDDGVYSTELPSTWVSSVSATNIHIKSTDIALLDSYIRVYLRQTTVWESDF